VTPQTVERLKVVDASAICAVLFAEPEGDLVAERMGSHSLVAPPLVVYEVANTCWKKLRRHPGLRDQLLAAHARLPELRLRLQDVAMPKVLLLADQTGLTVYDAAYAWLSRSLRAELVSLDARLIQAAIASS
jgi:predicted nucleic acid-binding protein